MEYVALAGKGVGVALLCGLAIVRILKTTWKTAEQVTDGQDLTGVVVIVTGANAGIGLETTRVLALRGATVIMGCRTVSKAEAAAAGIRESVGCPEDRLRILPLDLCQPSSIISFCKAFRELGLPLHHLILNAGVFPTSYDVVPGTGFEATFASNHMGHFSLTLDLLPLLQKTAADRGQDSRVVMVSSMSSFDAPKKGLDFNRLTPAEGTKAYFRYAQSKLCNCMHAAELDRRYADTNVRAYSLHPGAMMLTDIGKDSWLKFVLRFVAPFTRTMAQGAATTLYCATSSEVEGTGGGYYSNCQQKTPPNGVLDAAACARLWDLSVDYHRQTIAKL